MRNNRVAYWPVTGVAFRVPYVNAIDLLVDAIGPREQNGNSHIAVANACLSAASKLASKSLCMISAAILSMSMRRR